MNKILRTIRATPSVAPRSSAARIAAFSATRRPNPCIGAKDNYAVGGQPPSGHVHVNQALPTPSAAETARSNHLAEAARRLELGTVDGDALALDSLRFAGVKLPLVNFIVSVNLSPSDTADVRHVGRQAALNTLQRLRTRQDHSDVSTAILSVEAGLAAAGEFDSLGTSARARNVLRDHLSASVEQYLNEGLTRLSPASARQLHALLDKIWATK